MKVLTKQTFEYDIDNEQEATDVVEQYKSQQAEKGYILSKSAINYKSKKDRKTGEIVEEHWITTVTISYVI